MTEETVAAGGPRSAVYEKRFVSRPSYKGTVMMDIAISYPQVDVWGNPQVSQRISTFYREAAKWYYDKVSHSLFDNAVKEYLDSFREHIPFRPYSVVQTFETPYNHGPLLSIFYERYEFTGGAHGDTTRFADTWRLPEGVRLKLGDFFDGSYYKSVFFEYITNDIRRQIDEGNTYYFDDYVKNVFRYFDEDNYYLTDKGFAVYFPLYTIAAYVQGIPTFIVPYETFGHSLKRRLFA